MPSKWKLQSTERYLQMYVSAPQTFKQRVYLGIAEGNWKQRLYNHRQCFKDKKHKTDTALSRILWDLKENHNRIPKLTWSIVRFAPGYSNIKITINNLFVIIIAKFLYEGILC